MATPHPKVENFARETIQTYDSASRHLTDTTARARTVAAVSAAASEKGLFPIGNAAAMARASVDTFREKRAAGMSSPDAAKAAAKEVGERFDDRGRDTQRHERQRLNAMSL
jgi:hypothetical protein